MKNINILILYLISLLFIYSIIDYLSYIYYLMLGFKYIPLVFLPLSESLIIPFFLFFSGVLGLLLSNNNVLRILVSIEIILLCCSLFFLIFSIYLLDPIGQLFSLIILVLAAAESVVGLTFLIVLFNTYGTSSLNGIITFRG